MYAIVATGGKQYKVREGDILRVEKLEGDIGDSISFDKVLMFSDGESVELGRPVLENVSVNGHIVKQDKSNKILVFKYKSRVHYRRRQGHRQQYTLLEVKKIVTKSGEKDGS